MAHPANFNLNSSNLFAECIFTVTGGQGTDRALLGVTQPSNTGGSSTEGWVLEIGTANFARAYVYNTGGTAYVAIGTTTTVSVGSTYHFALSWDSNTKIIRVFLNGKLQETTATATGTIQYSQYFSFQIGSMRSFWVPIGAMYDSRVIQGGIVPTASFTPQSTTFTFTPPSYVSGGTVVHALTSEPLVQWPSLNTLQMIPATPSFINMGSTHPANFNMSTSNLFGECWWYYQGTGSDANYRMIMGVGDASNTVFRVYYYPTNLYTAVDYWNTGGTVIFSSCQTIPTMNAWTHIAWSWDYTANRFWTFVNGGVGATSPILSGTIKNSSTYSVLVGSAPWFLGSTQTHLLDMRIIKGGIVPTTNFSIPALGYFSNTVPSYVTGTGAVPVMALYVENIANNTPTVAVAGNVYASNAVSTGINLYTTSLNTGIIFPNKNSTGIGIGTFSNVTNALQVNGNVYASNAITIGGDINTYSVNLFTNQIQSNVLVSTTWVPGGVAGVLNVVAYSGYMSDNPAFFASATVLGSSTSSTFTNLGTATNGLLAVNQSTVSAQWTGYFVPTQGGTWSLAITSDDCSYMWIGPYATSGYTTGNASASNPGTHGMTTSTYTASFISGQYYPIRIQYGAGGSPNDFNFAITPPGGSATYSPSAYIATGNPFTLSVGSALGIQGNVYASNNETLSNSVSNIGYISYVEDINKRYIHSLPTPTNSGPIQQWISAQINAVSLPTKSWWATSSLPQFGNRWRGPQGQSDYFGSILLNDGRVLFSPAKASNIGFFNWKLQEFSTVTPVGFGGNYNGAVLLPSGNVVCVANSANVGMFNPLDLTWSNVGPFTALGSAFMGGVLAPDGNVVHVPYNSANVGLFNPRTFTFANIGPISGPSIGSFNGGVLLPNGKVVFAPYNSANIGMFDPTLQIFTNIGPIAGPTGAFSGAVLAPWKCHFRSVYIDERWCVQSDHIGFRKYRVLFRILRRGFNPVR
jgi:GLEYA domain